MKKIISRFAVITVLSVQSIYAADNPVSFGGFVDTYYAFDANQPGNFDRAYTTQPARHNEFNVNLAHVDAQLKEDRVHGRIALQVGTSVQSNYSTEPSWGTISGPSLGRHIQEGYVGYRIAEGLWVDAGIYFSHIGAESWISRDNMTYTRSLVADYSPYYQSGAKVTYQLSKPISLQLHVVNGWQTISESNLPKSLGSQVAYSFSDTTSLTYNTLFGKELGGYRHFHDFIFKMGFTQNWSMGLQADIGFQRGAGSWNGQSLISRYALMPTLAFVGRIERYSDPSQIIVTTLSKSGFQVFGASLGTDVQLHTRVMWRTEVRAQEAKDAIYPKRDVFSGRDLMVVTSLSLTI